MKFNGTIFSKPQQDQLKENIGNELEKIDARMLNYKGDWVDGDEYHVNDIVTWNNDGHLYEVIKAHTSSTSIKPDNAEYYKAMTTTKLKEHSFDIGVQNGRNQFVNYVATNISNIAFIKDHNGTIYKNIEKYADAVSMSKIIASYDTYGRIESIKLVTNLVKTNTESVRIRDYILNTDGTISVSNNSSITKGTFIIYSY